MVSATVDGLGQVQSVHVSEEALRGSDREGIEEMLAVALKDAQSRAKRQRDERIVVLLGRTAVDNVRGRRCYRSLNSRIMRTHEIHLGKNGY